MLWFFYYYVFESDLIKIIFFLWCNNYFIPCRTLADKCLQSHNVRKWFWSLVTNVMNNYFFPCTQVGTDMMMLCYKELQTQVVLLRFRVWLILDRLGLEGTLKLQPLSPTWPVLLASLQVTGWGQGEQETQGKVWRSQRSLACPLQHVWGVPMSQMSPLPLLESRARGDTKVMALVVSRGGSSSLEPTDLGVCSYFKIAFFPVEISPLPLTLPTEQLYYMNLCCGVRKCSSSPLIFSHSLHKEQL